MTLRDLKKGIWGEEVRGHSGYDKIRMQKNVCKRITRETVPERVTQARSELRSLCRVLAVLSWGRQKDGPFLKACRTLEEELKGGPALKTFSCRST